MSSWPSASPPLPSGRLVNGVRFVNGVRSALALALRAAGDA